MKSLDWADLVERYIKRGEAPYLSNPMVVEEPETYLEGLYSEASQPKALRDALIDTIRTATRTLDAVVLGRALRLVALVPHTEFGRVLQNAFFVARSAELHGPYGEITMQALRAMHALQPVLNGSAEESSLWEAMWIALLGDGEYGTAAYQGLRSLDVSIAIRKLHLLLRLDESEKELKRILRGLKRDVSHSPKINFEECLADAIAELRERELITYYPLLLEAFGNESVDHAIEKAATNEEARIEQTLASLAKRGNRLELLRGHVSDTLAEWLRGRIPVGGVSLWLVDNVKKEVLFMAHSGCPGGVPSPSSIFAFGKSASGIVAESRKNEFFDLDDPQSRVYKRTDFVDAGMHGLFSVFQQEDTEPSLTLVVNFFDESTKTLEVVEDACIRDAALIARVCQHLLAVNANRHIASLTAKLVEQPTLVEVANTFIQELKEAIPCNYIDLYLLDPSLRQLVLHDSYRQDNLPPLLADEALRQIKVPKRLMRFDANASPVRLRDLRDELETTKLGQLFPEIGLRLTNSSLEEFLRDKNINFLGMPLREPAPSGFVGSLVGAVTVYRSVEKNSGMVFTPLREHIFVELSRAATPSLLAAFRNEQQPVLRTTRDAAELVKQLDMTRNITEVQKEAETDFQIESGSLLESWPSIEGYKRIFSSYRTFRDRCQPFWHSDKPPMNKEERAARHNLQTVLLTSGETLLAEQPIVPVDSKLLADFGIQNAAEELLRLNLILVPIFCESRLDGIVGLEFETAREASRVAERVRSDEIHGPYVRGLLLRIWQNHRQYLRMMFARNLVRWAKEITEYSSMEKNWPRLLSFLAGNLADPPPQEFSSSVRLMAMALKGPYFDAKCNFSRESKAWNEFVPKNHMEVQISSGVSEELIAKSSWVRTVVATATAVALCGGSASLLLEESKLPQRSSLRVEVQPNGHKQLGEEGLARAKVICDYRGWDYESDERGISIAVPNYQ